MCLCVLFYLLSYQSISFYVAVFELDVVYSSMHNSDWCYIYADAWIAENHSFFTPEHQVAIVNRPYCLHFMSVSVFFFVHLVLHFSLFYLFCPFVCLSVSCLYVFGPCCLKERKWWWWWWWWCIIVRSHFCVIDWPVLFNVYVDDLFANLRTCGAGQDVT